MSGYDAPWIAYLVADLPVEILGRMRSDRVLLRPAPPRVPGTNGRPPQHGGEFVFGDRATWGAEQAMTTTDTRLYGTATARVRRGFHNLHTKAPPPAGAPKPPRPDSGQPRRTG